MNAPAPIEIDPRPCELCGLTIDLHQMVDHGEGPEFYCYPDNDLVTLWELADPRDRWRHIGERPPPASVRNGDISGRPESLKAGYATPDSTEAAFWYVVSLENPARLRAWLADHPRDLPYLLKLLESK